MHTHNTTGNASGKTPFDDAMSQPTGLSLSSYAAPEPSEPSEPSSSSSSRPAPLSPPSRLHSNVFPPVANDVDTAASASSARDSAHDWQSFTPDTALLPPPPAYFASWQRSPANNASADQAMAGEDWCDLWPLFAPQPISANGRAAVDAHTFDLIQPDSFHGHLKRTGTGVWHVRTMPAQSDCSLLSFPALYSPLVHSPLVSGRTRRIYYEIFVRPESRPEVSLVIGFAAPPYPPFRLPGWHRGCLGVHGDDGHRYVSNDEGGMSFVDPFAPGNTYGLGMILSPINNVGGIDVKVVFTKNGVVAGGWDLHEETDSGSPGDGVVGLAGYHDLCAAIGAFDKVSFDVIFDPSLWKYKGLL